MKKDMKHVKYFFPVAAAVLGIFFTAGTATANGAAADTLGTWSLDSCMAYAIRHSTAVELQRVEARQARADCRWARAEWLPAVQAGVSSNWSWGRGIDPETNVYNTVTTYNNQYGLYASLTVFDGMRTLNAFRQARMQLRASAAALDKARDAKAIEVMQLYTEAAYAQACTALAAQKQDESRLLVKRTRRMMELGTKSGPDVAQAEAQLAQDDYALTRLQNDEQRALLALKAAMNWPAELALHISAATVQHAAVQTGADLAESLYTAFEQRSPEVAAARAAAQSARYTWLQQRGALLPALTLDGGISTNYYRNLSQGQGTAPFSRQLSDNRGEYLGFTLSIPLFMPSAWRAARRAKSQWQTACINLDDTRRRLHDSVIQAVADRDSYAREAEQLVRQVQSDSVLHRLNTRKYEEGMLSTFELHTSSQTLLQARIQLLQTRMLLAVRQRLVMYYRGMPLYTEQQKP